MQSVPESVLISRYIYSSTERVKVSRHSVAPVAFASPYRIIASAVMKYVAPCRVFVPFVKVTGERVGVALITTGYGYAAALPVLMLV